MCFDKTINARLNNKIEKAVRELFEDTIMYFWKYNMSEVYSYERARCRFIGYEGILWVGAYSGVPEVLTNYL